jgi:mono/diheme cytochrome c family protein
MDRVRRVSRRSRILGTLLLAAWAGAVGASTARQADPPPPAAAAQRSPDQLAKDVYSIFQRSCFDCHAEFGANGLDLRSDASLQKGGDGGRVVVAHDPQASRLFRFVSHLEDPKMPDGGPKLPDADLETIRLWILAGASLAAVPEANTPAEGPTPPELAAREDRPITDEERAYWAFVRPVRPVVPDAADPAWNRNPIDALLFSAMTAKGLKPSPRADRRSLVRRVYLDVVGLPPSPAQVEAFVRDERPDAWERLVDELLASPHYGERWARHWMDLVRYADSGGFEFDRDRDEMYRYRDYLIESFNADTPYDRFVKEQIAGDEIAPDSDAAMIATGYLRLGPEGGGTRLDALDDLITTTSLAFMGVTVGCARCHNHKFDPIPQKDYYRMQAVFFSTRGVDHPLVPAHEAEAIANERRRIDRLQAPLRKSRDAIADPVHAAIVVEEVAKLPEYMQVAWRTPAADRTAAQKLNAKQIEEALGIRSLRKLITEDRVMARMPDDARATYEALKTEIAALERQKPASPPSARVIGERGRDPRPSYFLHRGSESSRGSVMTPGVLSVASTGEWTFAEPPADATSSWRRRGFAEWLVTPDNPLTARVMVNRLWQHHFGEGLVRTPSNFGRMGTPPSHPELLDWLAVEFVERGWSLKAMHRLMLTSEAYRMSSLDRTTSVGIDPENRLLWRMPRVRLEAEIIRDAILSVAGSLDTTVGGPAIFPYIDPDLFEKSSNRDWPGKPDDDPSTWRRSLYVFSKRSIRYPMFETFDQPNLINSMDRRNRTTIAPQALILMNNGMVIVQAERFADRVRREAGDDPGAQVDRAVLLALARPADAFERERAVAFVREAGLAEFCHVLFNLNEFLFRQ